MPHDTSGSQLEDPSISEEEHLEIDEHDLQKGKEEAIEVSYSVITTDHTAENQTSDDLLQKIGTMVNVQLAEEGSEKLPFIPFSDFERARASDKLFLYGPSCCGKSRAMFELVRENLAKFKKIYFINPRNTIGAESGRIKLLDLLGKIEEDDGVVWDNFPDDLIKRDVDTAKHVLDLVSSRQVKRLFIALKPRYLEIYKDLPREIPDFNSCEVAFDKDRLRKIISAYGTSITEFKDPFQKYIEEHADKISKTLWQKEPTPLTILGYYKLLKDRVEEQKKAPDLDIDPIREAEGLLRRTDYYEQQFEMICRVQERRNDTEFLYTLKLCYECGLDRTVSSVEALQHDIFSSVTPQDALSRLSTWVYVSGQYYAMHDAQRESIKFSDHVRLKIMDYLTRNFMKVVPTEDSQLNAFGLFLGRNIQYVHKQNLHQFLGPEIQEFMKKNRYFQTALGQGVGESFLALDDELQEEMMKRMAVDIEFARGAVLGIGERFPILDRIRQREILEEKSKRFACVPLFAESVGINFKAMTDDLRKELFETAERNPQFADGFGRGLGSNIKFFEQPLREEIFERAMKNSEFTRGFGYSHAFHFIAGDKNEQKKIFEIADRNSHFSIGLGMGFAYLFGHLSEGTLQQVFERTAADNEFAFGLGLYLGFNFHPLSPELQNWQLKTIDENGRFAYGLGYGYGITFPYYPEEIQSSLFERAEKNVDFAYGLGSGLGYSFGSLNEKLRESIFTKIKSNPEFAAGLGSGLGFVSVLLPPKVWTD
ncbi:MAG: RNA helicase domain-containing protein, partial [Thermoproteota archaeon]|nr:RNA helicase domain-containing protein [Thermoproteota archaeon]